jgi:diacylglycerol O-acyltransferase / wax synthase
LAADRHAHDILATERWSHVQVELTLNRFLSSFHLLASGAAVYYITLNFVVTPLVLFYLWRGHPARPPLGLPGHGLR